MSSIPRNDAQETQLRVPEQPLPVGPSVAEGLEARVQGGKRTQLAAPAAAMEMDEAAKQEFLWHTHDYLSEYARFGDTKAAFAGTIAAALLGALYTEKTHVPMVETHYSEWTIFTWLAAGGGLFLIGSILLAIWTVLPRLRNTQSKGFVFWDSITAHSTLELLQTSFHGQSARTLNDHLLHQIFDISAKVCVPKYRAVRFCICALVIGGFLTMAALVLQDTTP